MSLFDSLLDSAELTRFLGIFRKLRNFGNSFTASSINGPKLVELAQHFDISVDTETADKIAAAVPEFASNPEQTMTDFVAGGGFMQMLFSKYRDARSGNPDGIPATINRCAHCHQLNF